MQGKGFPAEGTAGGKAVSWEGAECFGTNRRETHLARTEWGWGTWWNWKGCQGPDHEGSCGPGEEWIQNGPRIGLDPGMQLVCPSYFKNEETEPRKVRFLSPHLHQPTLVTLQLETRSSAQSLSLIIKLFLNVKSFSSGHVWMWELDYKESWAQENWCFWTVVLEKTLESPLDCKEMQPVLSKGDQSWVFIGRTDVEAETPIRWPPHAKSWLIGKDPDDGKDWGQEEKGATEDKMVGWHHWLNGHGFGWTLGVGDGQGGLACCGSWGHKELDTTEQLNWTELNWMLKRWDFWKLSNI